MLQLSRMADYGMRLLAQLGKDKDVRLSAPQLAKLTDLGEATVAKLLKQLHNAGLVKSVRGVKGGYQLNKCPHQMNVLEVIEAVDGKMALTKCADGQSICPHDETCVTRDAWQQLNSDIRQTLSQKSVADMTGQTTPKTEEQPV